MTDFNYFMIGCLIAALAGVLFLYFNIYGGVYGSLASARVGDVCNFRYFQPLTGDYDRYLAKVVNIRKLDNFEIGRLNMTSDYRIFDKDFKRSPTLITCLMKNGDYRNFYAERSDCCKRSAIGGLLFKANMVHLF